MTGQEEPLEAEEARRDSPEAVVEREASQTEYEGLGSVEAASVAQKFFPSLTGVPGGGLPQLPAGARVAGFLGGNIAQVELGEGQNAVLESTAPLALASSPGQWKPIDLALTRTGSGFGAANPLVEVAVPQRASGGIQLERVGVSLTPVGGAGTAVGGSEGELDGAAVLYANTQTDTDTAVKPTTFGFDAISLLRSAASPQQLDYRVGLAAGESLAQEGATGPVQIVKENTTLATIATPSARDATGATVPVSMSLSGDRLTIDIPRQSDSFTYPIEVDPELTTSENFTAGNWHASAGAGYTLSTSHDLSPGLSIEHTGSYAAGDTAYWAMATNGNSKIYKFATSEEFYPAYDNNGVEGTYPSTIAWLELLYGTSEKHELRLTGAPDLKTATLCANGECSPAGVNGGNAARFEMTTAESSAYYEANGLGYLVPFGTFLRSVTTYIGEPSGEHATVGYNRSTPTISGTPNIFYGSTSWFGPYSGAFEFTAKDLGLGVAAAKVEYDGKTGWRTVASTNYLTEASCKGVQCAATQSLAFTSGSGELSTLPSGEDKIRVAADDPVPNSWSSEYYEGEETIKVDTEKPHGISLTGLASKGEELQLGEVQAHIKAEASDGEGSTPSSGIKSLELYVDGRETGQPAGSCSRGPCTATGEWSINGAELGSGSHVLTVKATDNAGNIATKEYALAVYAANPLPLSPGSVNPESGDFALDSSDVAVSGGSGSLAVTRHYDSRNVKEGEEGPLGPQWTISLGSLASLEVLPDGSVMAIGQSGLTHFSVKKGGGFEAPTGDSNLTLRAEEGSKKEVLAYFLEDPTNGTSTKFTLPSGAKVWMPTLAKGPIATDTMTDEYTTAEPETGKKIVEPILEVAPHPQATCELKKLEKGCRALEFVYAKGTTAKGQAEKEWGEYNGHLAEVVFIAYNPAPAIKAMASTPVARYSYDSQGRLRAEWNPALGEAKTTYGYDAEGHITAVSPAGEQPWLLHYGTTEGDASTGRLLSVSRPPASTPAALKAAQEAPAPLNSEAPKLSSAAPVEGTELTSTTGVWSNSPQMYGYQWERCNASGGECAPIPGAVDPAYTVRYGKDEGSALRVKVTATDADGSTTASSTATAAVPSSTVLTFADAFGAAGSGNAQFKSPQYIAYAKTAEVWKSESGALYVTDTGNNRVEVFGEAGKYLGQFGTTGTGNKQFKEPTGISAREPEGRESEEFFNPTEDVLVADSGNKRLEWLDAGGSAYNKSLASETAGVLGGIASGRYFLEAIVANRGASELEKYQVLEGDFLHSGHFGSLGTENGKLKEPADLVWSPANRCWYVLDTGNSRVQYFAEGWTYEGQFGKAGTGNGQFKEPKGIAVDAKGDIYVVDTGNNRVEEFSATGTYMKQFGATGTAEGKFTTPIGIAISPAGNVSVVDSANNRVETWTATALPAEPSLPAAKAPGLSTTSVSTIDYRVPVSGAGAEHALGASEVAKWGEKDDPVEATAVFPPDEPMGWPAKDYKRATVYYFDGNARTVNIASPAGGVSTQEYNENNEVDRSLDADDRAAALKEECKAETECKSAEVARLLDTQSVYNTAGQLTETRGPQHTVKLAFGKEGKAGEEVLARNHVRYYYDENAPKGETFDLVTKTEDAAETASKEEFDKRTAATAYSGQGGLGWKLRKPTSETTEPSGLALTTTTEYEEATGNVKETKTPAAAGKDAAVPLAYESQFGSKGSGSGQISGAVGDGIDSAGHLWVADSANNRLDELSASGAFMQAIGFGVSNGKAEAQTCTTSCKAGIAGSGSGQFSDPTSIVFAGGYMYVADYANNRVEKLTEAGSYTAQIGAKGTAAGQLEHPISLAVNSAGNLWVGDHGNNRIDEFSAAGTFIEAAGFGVSKGEEKLEVCTSSCRAGISGSKEGQFGGIEGIAAGNAELYVADATNNRIDGFIELGQGVEAFGSKGSGNGQFNAPTAVAINPATESLYVLDRNNDRVQQVWPSGTYINQFGSKGVGNGQLANPEGIAVNSSGDAYVLDTGNNRIEEWVPSVTGNASAHDVKTIYYTAKTEAEAAVCREHPEWVGLPCQTIPIAQPGGGLPELPTTITTYNMWDQAETLTETFAGKLTRTKRTTFDEAGRPLTTEETSSNDTPLPAVTDTYSATSGALIEQSTTTSGVTQTITRTYNTLGQLESYTDAKGNTAKYSYDEDGRVTRTTDGSDGGAAEQTYGYDKTTGALTRLVDSGAGVFTASYDPQGKMTSESYPNGMTVYYTDDPAGATTGLEYKKLTDCTEKCVLFTDTMVPSIHGEPMKQASTLSEEPSYTYDPAGRLTQVQEMPAGEGCTTRNYAYDEDSNRTTLTTSTPGAEGKCSTENPVTEWHTYDTADRLTDAGVAYEAFGNITALPAADAGGSTLTSEYYVDNQVHNQTQSGKKIAYKLDPEDRTLETTTNGEAESTITTHYDGPGTSVSWTSEASGGWTRNVAGIGGELAAIQTSAKTTLQLHDLQGDIVGTIGDNEAETSLLTKYNSTEFGVPNAKETPPSYAWLGAEGVASELPSGTITQDGSTYVPQTGRTLQTEGVAPLMPTAAGTPFVSAIPSWVAATASSAAAHQIAVSEEERRAQEIANAPAGEIPVPEGEGEGEIAGGAGGGLGLVPLSRPNLHAIGCSVWGTIHFPGGPVVAKGYFRCNSWRPNKFELLVCIEQEGVSGGLIDIACGYRDGEETIYSTTKGKVFTSSESGSTFIATACTNGVFYRAQAWGWAYWSASNWWLTASEWSQSSERGSTSEACIAASIEWR